MTTSDASEIQEEYFESEQTGVELEDDTNSVIEEPWNPDDIRVASQNFALRNILDMIDDGDLELTPEFQRQRVWKPPQKSRLIESILLRIPLPAFYFSEDPDGKMHVVDGYGDHRLTAMANRGDARCDVHPFDDSSAEGGPVMIGIRWQDSMGGLDSGVRWRLWIQRFSIS